jgi:thiosulfate/3-mercaptopyruvate sulfurtransferase
VAVLDGGFPRWRAEGRPVETGPASSPAPQEFRAVAREGWVVSKHDVRAALKTLLLLDARAPERYRGDVEPIDPRPGHLPGARSAPFSENLSGDALPVFLPAEQLRERFVALGADRREPVVYCGSGVTACHDLLALEIAGLRGRLYPGSWSEWSADPACDAATGPE